MANKDEKSDLRYIIRVANVDLPGDKQINIALTNIKGIGRNLADALLALAGIDKQTKAGALDDDAIARLNDVVADPLAAGIPVWMINRRRDYETGEDKHLLTGKLQFTKENDLKRLQKIKSLRGLRHRRGLPVRGQRTRSNFRKGKGKVVGVKKKGK